MKNLKHLIPYKSHIKKGVFGAWNSFKYFQFSNSPASIDLSTISRIHFVCKGNICRSAFAEKLAMKKMLQNNIPVSVISSGIDADQGNQSPDFAVEQAKKWDIDLSTHVPKKTSKDLLDCHTLLIGMHYIHYKQLNILYPEFKKMIFLLKHFSRKDFLFIDLNDPYNHSAEIFFQCFSEINICVDGLISEFMRNC